MLIPATVSLKSILSYQSTKKQALEYIAGYFNMKVDELKLNINRTIFKKAWPIITKTIN